MSRYVAAGAVVALALSGAVAAPAAPSSAAPAKEVLVYAADVNATIGAGLYRSDVDGRHRVAILPDDGRTNVFLPRVSPSGSHVAAGVGRPGAPYALRIMRIDGTGMTTVQMQQVTGRLRTYITGVSWAPDGTKLVYGVSTVPVGLGAGSDVLRVVNTSGAPRPVTLPGSTGLGMPAYDPTGRTIAAVSVRVVAGHTTFSLVLFDPASRARRTLLTGTGPIGQPTWSPDGRRLAWATETTTGRVIVVRDNATGRRTTVAGGRGVVNDHPSYAPDGWLWFDRYSATVNADLWAISPRGAMVQVTRTPGSESSPSVARTR